MMTYDLNQVHSNSLLFQMIACLGQTQSFIEKIHGAFCGSKKIWLFSHKKIKLTTSFFDI